MNEKKSLVPYSKSRSNTQVVTVSGGKGGIGKTFFTVNFGVELHNRGYRVLIFDGDINLSNVYLLLGIDENSDFEGFVRGETPIGEVIKKGIGGVDVLFFGGEPGDIFKVGDDDFNRIVEGLSQIENEYDFILVDTQAGLTDFNRKLQLRADRNILIANPEITALVDLYKVVKVAASEESGLHFEIVINRAHNAQEAARVYERVSKTVSHFRIRSALSFLGFILEDTHRVVESIQKRVPMIVLHNTGQVNECFKLIANAFLRNVKRRRSFPFFYGLLER